jgi:serine protease Do
VAFLWLGVGIGIGLTLGRLGAPLLSAQGTRAEPEAAAPAPGSDRAAFLQLQKQYERFREVDQTFGLVSRIVAPAVVHIVARKHGVREDGTPARFEETGSGVIVRADADNCQACYVLTNHHVVSGSAAPDIGIYLHDGSILKPDRLWTDEKVDVAVLRLTRSDLPTAQMGNSDEVSVGHWVLALGSPFGLTHSVSQGIISARGRYEQELEEDGVENQDFLQTDAAINLGNSGGPLVNLRGEVVGINTAIASTGGGSEGVGFSIPVNLARWALNQLITQGRVDRGAIGVRLQALTPQVAIDLGLASPRGARIESVQRDTPAEKSGLQSGDVILKFNNIEINDYNQLINHVSMAPIGQNARLVVWRDRKSLDIDVSVADRGAILAASAPAEPQRDSPEVSPRRARPRPADPSSDDPTVVQGLHLTDIDSLDAARSYGLPSTTRGVLVARIEPASPFAPLLEPADLLQAVDGRPVLTSADVARALSSKGTHSLQILRDHSGASQNRIVEIQIP